MLRIQCKHCDNVVCVDDEDLGTRVECGACEQVIEIPKQRIAPQMIVSGYILKELLSSNESLSWWSAHDIACNRTVKLCVKYSESFNECMTFIERMRELNQLDGYGCLLTAGDDNGVLYGAFEVKSVLRTVIR